EAAWERIWCDGPWDPVRLREPDGPLDCPWAESLESWIDRTEQAVGQAAEEEEGDARAFVDLGAVTTTLIRTFRAETDQDLTDKLEPNSVAVHLDFLHRMGLVDVRSDPAGTCYRVRRPAGPALRRPPRPPAGVTRLTWGMDRLPAALRDSLGFGQQRGPAAKNNDQAVGQLLYNAFLAPPGGPLPAAAAQGSAGRESVLTPFEAGDGPGWIVQLCRAYARDTLGWTDEQTWPVCLRGR
ncbi:MAG: hypothetical protein ACKODX_20160, partial [Gemmata sp.]